MVGKGGEWKERGKEKKFRHIYGWKETVKWRRLRGITDRWKNEAWKKPSVDEDPEKCKSKKEECEVWVSLSGLSKVADKST